MLSLVGPGSRRRPEEDLDEQFLVGADVAGSSLLDQLPQDCGIDVLRFVGSEAHDCVVLSGVAPRLVDGGLPEGLLEQLRWRLLSQDDG